MSYHLPASVDGFLACFAYQRFNQKTEAFFCQLFLTLGQECLTAIQRSFILPTAVDAEKVKASYKDGLLQVVLPKAEEAKPKQTE